MAGLPDDRPDGLDSPVTAKVIKYMSRAQGAAFKATNGRLKEIPLPTAPPVRYAAAVVKKSEAARRFVAGLKNAPALRAAGFEAP